MGEADVGTTDDQAATVPIRRHHKRSSARCTSPESVSSRPDSASVRRKLTSGGLASRSSWGELRPDTAEAHPLLSAFPRRSSLSQPLVPGRERHSTTSSRNVDSDSAESAASLSDCAKAEHGKRLGLADCLFPASSRSVDRAEPPKYGARRHRDRATLNERPLLTATEDADRSLIADAEILASRAADLLKACSLRSDHLRRSLKANSVRQSPGDAVNKSSGLPVVVDDSRRMAELFSWYC